MIFKVVELDSLFIFELYIYIYFIFYIRILGYDTVFPKSSSINLPMYLDFFLELDFILFNLFCLYYIYNILFKFSFKNIYFKKVQVWTFSFFMVIVTQLIFILFSVIFKNSAIKRTKFEGLKRNIKFLST